MKTIRIFHTNDIHSHFEAYPKIATFLKDYREGSPSITVDIGDNMDRFHPITEATLGKANTTMLNVLQYDYATIGNNEGITMNYDALSNLYSEATFPVLIGNLYEKDGQRPSWVMPHCIHVVDGVKIGFIGITVFYEMFYEQLGWKMEDPYISLENSIRQIKGDVDAIIVMSHLGITDDEELARRFPDIDVILGGHTHHVLPTGKVIGNTLICGAGKHGNYIGEVHLQFEDKGIKKWCELHALKEFSPSLYIEEMIDEMEQKANRDMQEVVHTLTEPIINSWIQPTELTNLLADALKQWCEADVGMVNAGVILGDLSSGEVTRGMIHKICPHPINPCLITVRGEELKELVLHAATEEMEQFPIKGLGFRGERMGCMVYSGLHYTFKTDRAGTRHIDQIFINGTLLEAHKQYRIGTLDMFTFGYLFPILRKATNKTYYLPELLRDVITWKLQSCDM